jgi:release factor glutamine methyltransferase
MSTTLVALWNQMRRRLHAVGVESPVLDARLLLQAGAGIERADIVTDPHRPVTEAQQAAVEVLIARREAREPVGYILGRKQFWNLELGVSPAVLIPRPETEFVVAAALEQLAADKPARVLDLGIGSGAILLAILSERPLASGVGLDCSAEALAVAAANASELGLGQRVAFVAGGWDRAPAVRFDMVVSNPPYIRSGEIDALAPELRYEPRLALDGGPDGLDAYRAIFTLLPALLAPGGSFAFEVGAGQADAVAALARAQGYAPDPPRRDFAGIPRVVAGQAEKSLGERLGKL